MCIRPALAPFNVIPRMKNIVSTIYGNNDVKYTTLPELCMPFITIKNTTVHDSNKHSTIHHLKPPLSSIFGAASNVVRYQKYAVSDERSHSTTIDPFG